MPDHLGSADLVEEVSMGASKVVKVSSHSWRGRSTTDPPPPSSQVTGCHSVGHTVSVLVCGSNKLVLEEAERSIHDALCVIRCLVKNRWATTGGRVLQQWAGVGL